jgi:hypothetical protein
MTSDRILGGIFVAVAAAMAAAASRYVSDISYEPVGPRAFPLLRRLDRHRRRLDRDPSVAAFGGRRRGRLRALVTACCGPRLHAAVPVAGFTPPRR